MDPLRTTAPVATPAPRPLLPQQGIGALDKHMPTWDRIRESGKAPAWTVVLDQLPAHLDALQARHPDLQVAWRTDPAGIDTSVRLPVLELGAPDGPTMFVVGGQHGREVAAAAGVMSWVERLLDARAAGDPQADWILRSRRIVAMPVANPRGISNALAAIHAAPSGPPASFTWKGSDPATPFRTFFGQRRNQSTETGGVDLNRNHAGPWQPAGPGHPPLAEYETYPGPSAASEPETRIIDHELTRTRPDLVVDAHQFGNFALAAVPAEASDGDIAAAEFALWRAFEPAGLASPRRGTDPADHGLRRSSEPVEHMGGTLETHAVARGASLGITIEAGEAFIVDDRTWPRVRDTYADALTRLARTTQPGALDLLGPDVSSSARRTASGWNVGVSDARSGQAAIVAVELIDDPPQAPGTGRPLLAADGVFDEPFETARIPRELVTGAPVALRALDASGAWGQVTALRLAR